MKNLWRVPLFFSVLLFISCASAPETHAPTWATQATRTVDNGYIVYVGTGIDPAPERALFIAEGAALQDLANECSFAPKGTRIEDHYNEKIKYQYHAYAKVAVEIQDCDQAKKTLEPSDIREFANQPFTEQVKKYQDLVDTEEPTEVAEGAPVNMPAAEPAPGPTVVVVHDNMSFFVARQYVAYEKEVVILSPATTYAPGAPETVAMKKNISAPTSQVAQYEHDNPQVKTAPTTWSSLPNRPAVHTLKPEHLRAMTPHLARPPALRSPPRVSGHPGPHNGKSVPEPKPRMKRRKKGWGEN